MPPSIASEYLAKPRRFRLVRVIGDFEVIDTPTGPASMLPGDVVLQDVRTRNEFPVRKQDLAEGFEPMSPQFAAAYDAEMAKPWVDLARSTLERVGRPWSHHVLDAALRQTCGRTARSPAYQPCQREPGHDGPCAHELADNEWGRQEAARLEGKPCPARSCTRESGHEGPCTQQFAVPVGMPDPLEPCPARHGRRAHAFDVYGVCCCGAARGAA